MAEERLQKILAAAGVASRRASEELILAGRVSVDGRLVTELGAKVDASAARICVDGVPIVAEGHRYIILHKPAGFLSSPDPRAGYPCWTDLVSVPERLYAVGRLDQDSEGLLLLTNDGPLAQRFMHPRYEHAKDYLVEVEGLPNSRKVRRWQHGIMLDDGPTAPAEVVLLRAPPAVFAGARKQEQAPSRRRGRTAWLHMTLHEGRKRQLRRMVARLGHPALRVIRTGLGPLQLGDLRPGKWRDLSPAEVEALRALAARDAPLQPGRAAQAQAGTPVVAPQRTPETIAIDGPSASGKSSLGRMLARRLGYLYLDTGAMYRGVAALVLSAGVDPRDERAVTELAAGADILILDPGEDAERDVTLIANGVDITDRLRQREVEAVVSIVSAYLGVRKAMAAQQRAAGRRGRVVMVGRDIGTVIMPEAELKLYLDASAGERARRRHLQRLESGEPADMAQILADIKRRDEIDSGREHSPLTAAPDAILIDTTSLSLEEVFQRACALVEARVRGKPASSAPARKASARS